MVVIEPALEEEMQVNPYLREYIDELLTKTNVLPRYFNNLTVKDLADIRKNAVSDPNAANVDLQDRPRLHTHRRCQKPI